MKKSQKKYKSILLILCLILIAVIALLIVRQAYRGQDGILFYMDESARNGELQKKDALNQLLKDMQKDADDNTFIIQIYAKPVFENGDTEGNLYLFNDDENDCALSASIFLDESGEEVYRSKVFKPGDGIKKDKLEVSLPAGEYPATALFTATDLKTGDLIGNAAAGITITIKGQEEANE